MRALPLIALFILVATAHADPPPPVTVSGKAITSVAPSITFTINNPAQGVPRAHVFSMAGREVAELNALSLTRLEWDGKDYDQQNVEPGFYVVQIQQAGSFWHGPVIVNR